MADFSTQEGIDAFKAAKEEQLAWALACGLPGLQSAITGRVYALTISTDAFYETVHIGQVPRDEIERVKSSENGKRVYRTAVVPEERRKRINRSIDLTDEQVTQILDRWSEGRSAVDLPFVLSVWGRDGVERTA